MGSKGKYVFPSYIKMASLTLNSGIISFKKDDDYETTETIWKLIVPYLQPYDTIYEPFYCSGKSGNIITSFGFNVIHKDEDFFLHYNDYQYDIIVSNPPFSIKKKVFDTLKEIDKPFIMIVPVSTITKQFFRDKYKNEDITILIPPKRLQFSKKYVELNRCWFDCLFVCYKLGLDKQMIFL